MAKDLPFGEASSEVVVVAPFGRDRDVLCRVLARVPSTVTAIGREAVDPVAAVAEADVLLVTAEGLHHDAAYAFAARLADEPSWSNPPVVIVAEDGPTAEEAARMFRRARPGLPITILVRPCARVEIRSAVETALDHRRVQKRVRDELGERRSAEKRAEFLYHELGHRVGNLFAMMTVLATRTEAESTNSEEFREAFGARVQAMSATYAALRAGDGIAVDLHALVDLTVGAILADAGDRGRLHVSGPELQLPEKTASPLGLVLHELAVNARKYGAFSVETGRVDVSWTHADGQVALTWRETGGPPVVPASRDGFGTSVIRTAMGGVRGGSAEYRPDPSGVVCTIRFAL